METPPLHEALRAAMDSRAQQIRTAMPARVIGYNRTTQVADVRPVVWPDGQEPPVIPSVPVVWPRGGDGYMLMPLATNDTGLLVCCEADIAEWRRTGESGAPADEARHHLANSVFIPGLAPATSTLDAGPGGATVLSANDLRLGDSLAAEAVIGGNALRAALNTWLPLVQAAIVAGGGGDITAANTALLAAVDAALSPSVKVEV